MSKKLLSLSFVVVALAGCATGRLPTDPPFGYGSDHSYIASPQDKAMSCPALTSAIQADTPKLAAFKNARVARAVGQLLFGGIGSLVVSAATSKELKERTGIQDDSPFSTEAQTTEMRLKNRAKSLNEVLAAKNCQTVDIDAEISRHSTAQADQKPSQ